ncbi:hypothetical protein [Nocardia sp. GTS18]|uniref:hypothetical protein n=1 Tax=Nocardia sp. GTS18 TaxID=1778064 RepID=UPI0015EF97CB|nr:hypothetical protein [Nocardia sp. GTS18]
MNVVDPAGTGPPTQQHPETTEHQPRSEAPVAADDDVESAAQIVVSHLWNTEYEAGEGEQPNHIFQQLRTLAQWLTTTPGD